MTANIKRNTTAVTGLWLSVLISAIFPMLLGFVLAESFPDWRWSHYPFHALVESVGTVSALVIATLMVVMLRHGHLSRRYIMVACALTGMGLLDGFHSVLHVGVSFVWLHSIATLVGGVIFSTVWLPDAWLTDKRQQLLLLATISLSLMAGLFSVILPDSLPTMVVDGQFTLLAIFINAAGGIGFLIGSSYFIRDYWLTGNAQYVEAVRTEDMVFANHCLLFGIAALLFESSVLWDAGWWWWHILRLLAYLVVLVYFFVLFKKAQDKLVESEERFRLINSRVPGIVYQFKVDAHGNRSLPYVSPTVEQYIGLTAEEVINDIEKWFALTHPDDLPGLESSISESMQEMTVWKWEGRFIRPDDEICWLQGSSAPLKLPDGSVVWDGVFVDITASKDAEEALSLMSMLHNKIISESPIGIAIYDHTGQCIDANISIAEMVGATHEQVLAQNYNDIESWKKSGLFDVVKESIAQQQRKRHEIEVVTTFGKYASYNCVLVPFKLNNRQHMLLMLDDVTERRNTERLLRESEERLTRFMNSATDGFVIFDENFVIQDINNAAESCFLMDRDYVVGKHILDVYPNLEQTGRYEKYLNILKTGEPFSADDVTSTLETGVFSISVKAFKVGSGLGMILSDISKRKQAEEKLRQEKDKVQNYLDIVGVMLVALNREGEVTLINRKGCEILGYKENEIIGKNWFDNFIPERFRAEVKDVFGRLMKGEVEPVESFENLILTCNGEEKMISWNNIVFCDEAGSNCGILSSGNDITEIKQTEIELEKHRHHLEVLIEERTRELHNAQDELVRKERLATLGQLTATVSHELRNPLGAMRPSLYLLKKHSDQNDPRVAKALDVVDRNIDRCDHIIDELLDFTRITELERHVTRIDQWLELVVDELNIYNDVQLTKNLCLDDLELEIDADRLRRAIINVIENACQAMLDETQKDTHRPGSRLEVSSRLNGERVEIIISDNGVGIPAEIKEKIFEPLFSTRVFGVGLGMPTVRQIMQQHGGSIEINSNQGEGTAVTLCLPRN